MFCKACRYELRGLSAHRCPECGRGFNPVDPGTFAATRSVSWREIGLGLASVGAAVAITLLPWLLVAMLFFTLSR
jgi:hypothetical protein